MEVVKQNRSELILRQNFSLVGVILSVVWMAAVLCLFSQPPFNGLPIRLLTAPAGDRLNLFLSILGPALFLAVGFYLLIKSSEVGTYRFNRTLRSVSLQWKWLIGSKTVNCSLNDIADVGVYYARKGYGIKLRMKSRREIKLTNAYTDMVASNKSADGIPLFPPSKRFLEGQAEMIAQFIEQVN